jgi:hypothetical protein
MTQAPILALCLLIISCAGRETIKPEQLTDDAESNIVVSLRDGRLVMMSSWNYSVVQAGDTTYLRGFGKELLDGVAGDENRAFRGDIPFRDIESISKQSSSSVLYKLSMLLGFVVLALLSFTFLFRNPAGT